MEWLFFVLQYCEILQMCIFKKKLVSNMLNSWRYLYLLNSIWKEASITQLEKMNLHFSRNIFVLNFFNAMSILLFLQIYGFFSRNIYVFVFLNGVTIFCFLFYNTVKFECISYAVSFFFVASIISALLWVSLKYSILNLYVRHEYYF